MGSKKPEISYVSGKKESPSFGVDETHTFGVDETRIRIDTLLQGNTQVVQAKNIIDAQKNALELVKICEILRRKCRDNNIDYTPSYISKNVDHWLKWYIYTIAPYNTTSMKEIIINGQSFRVYNVFKYKNKMYKRFAHFIIDTLDEKGIDDFGI